MKGKLQKINYDEENLYLTVKYKFSRKIDLCEELFGDLVRMEDSFVNPYEVNGHIIDTDVEVSGGKIIFSKIATKISDENLLPTPHSC